MKNGQQLPLDRCPHCNVARPRLDVVNRHPTTDHGGKRSRVWWLYSCATCGGCVMTVEQGGVQNVSVDRVWPSPTVVSDDVPARARDYLAQAIASQHAPAGAVMLAASAVDAMLKDKGYAKGSLHARIEEAAAAHLITTDMAQWAHEVRLEANDQRHADDEAGLPEESDAVRAIEFVGALAQFLYVLPAMVARGRQS